jgi:ParB family chromosome partitioning protein
MARRHGLGRGLESLIRSDEQAPDAAPPPSPDDGLAAQTELAIDAIVPNPEQPRRVFEPAELERLAESIRQYGVLQPVVVRRAGERFELIVGERRWRAARAAGLAAIPAVIADVAAAERLEVALVENVQRRDLNPVELALAFRALADAGATQDQIGAKVGLDRSSIANHLRLLELSRDLQQDLESGQLSMGHAKALLQVVNPERRRHLRDRIVGQALSVRQAEALARDAGGAGAAPRPAASAADASKTRLSPDLQRVVDLLRDRLKTRVRIQGSAERGRIEIEYFGAEDLRRIVHEMLDPS